MILTRACLLYVAWDDETVDHWRIEEFKQGDMAHPLTEESSFATLFPKYREKYLQQVWPHVTRTLKEHVGLHINEECDTFTHTHTHTCPNSLRVYRVSLILLKVA